MEYNCWWEVIKNLFAKSKSNLASLSAHSIFYWPWNLLGLTILSFVMDRLFSLFVTICVSAYFWLKSQTQKLCKRIYVSSVTTIWTSKCLKEQFKCLFNVQIQRPIFAFCFQNLGPFLKWNQGLGIQKAGHYSDIKN